MADLTVLVPSRRRPHEAHRLYVAFRQTCELDTALVFAVDDDDPDLNIYQIGLGGDARVRVLVVPRGRAGMTAAVNYAFDALLDQTLGFAVGFMGDDHLPRTHGWDKAYVEALKEMGTGIVYGDDLFQGQRMPTQVAMTTDIPKKLGYFAPPELDHLCVDLAWKAWGDAMGRLRYLPEVVIEHLHPAAGKANYDDRYEATNGKEMVDHDGPAWLQYQQYGLVDDIRSLRWLL